MEHDNNKPIDYSRALFYADIGRKDKDWYKDCRRTFVKLFGESEIDLVCKLFAATSINTSLKANITLFRKAYYQLKNGLPIEGYMPNIKTQIGHVKAGRDLSGRKISNFAKAMSGDPNAVVVDIWLLRAYNQDRKYWRNPNAGNKLRGSFRNGGAGNKQYNLIEAHIKEICSGQGLTPAELCAMIWSGVRIDTGGDKTTRYTDVLQNKLTNLFGVI